MSKMEIILRHQLFYTNFNKMIVPQKVVVDLTLKTNFVSKDWVLEIY